MKPIALVLSLILLSACSARATSPATTSTIGIATPLNTVIPPTETPTAPADEIQPAPTAEPTAPPTKEAGIPPEFLTSITDMKDFRTKLAASDYCFVRSDVSDTMEGSQRASEIVDADTKFFQYLLSRRSSGEFGGIGTEVLTITGKGGCIIVAPTKGGKYVGAFFQSAFDPSQWIEVKFTPSKLP